MNQGASRSALAAGVADLEAVLAEPGVDAATVGGELFAVGRLLSGEIALRRTLTDPSRTGDERAEMFDQLLSSQVSEPTRGVIRTAVGERWASPRDLAGAFEDLAVRAIVTSAEQDGALDRLEDELFRFGRILLGNQDLRDALTGEIEAGRKAALLDALIGDKVTSQTRTLIEQAVSTGSSRSVEHTLDRYSAAAAALRERLVAHVRSVTELSDDQRKRLAAALSKMYGRSVALLVETDPSVLGGLAVRIGDEILAATVLARL
jgi:F-type H+-transporting ATPase subunit delta